MIPWNKWGTAEKRKIRSGRGKDKNERKERMDHMDNLTILYVFLREKWWSRGDCKKISVKLVISLSPD